MIGYNEELVISQLSSRLVGFKKVGKNKYKSPSGRTFTKKQVAMYYATGGFKKKFGFGE